MLIDGFHLVAHDSLTRASMAVTWETAAREDWELFVEVAAEGRDALWPDPNAALLACLLPAWHAGEKRIRIGADVCPALLLRLSSAITTLRLWYPELGPP